MIKRFGFRNYFSFKEGAVISFNMNKKTPADYYQVDGISTVIGVKGGNASGKTNILRMLGFISGFILRSDSSTGKIKIDSHFDNERPSFFFIEFVADNNIEYTYELTATSEKVVKEKIYKKNIKKTEIICREGNVVKGYGDISIVSDLELYSNASIISTCNKLKSTSTLSDISAITRFFEKIICNVGYCGTYNSSISFPETKDVSEKYYHDENIFSFVKHVLMESDSGISDIVIHKYQSDTGKDTYNAFFVYKIKNSISVLPLVDQSNGIKKLYRSLYLYFLVLKTGGVLVQDEFDENLHSKLLPNMISFFETEKNNPYNAQFIFTAHNTEIMNYLGKYRTVLVNKDNNESYCYRLDELPGNIIKNGRDISKLYQMGKIGGIPNISRDNFVGYELKKHNQNDLFEDENDG